MMKNHKHILTAGVIVFALGVFAYAQVPGQPSSPRTKAVGLVQRMEFLEQTAVPVGTVVPFFGRASDLPKNWLWLPCDGGDFFSSEYPELAALLKGRVEASSDPAKTRTPNLKALFLRGGDNPGAKGGSSSATTSINGEHQHGIIVVTGTVQDGAINRGRWFGDDNTDNQYRNASDGAHSHSVPIPPPPYCEVLYIIKAK